MEWVSLWLWRTWEDTTKEWRLDDEKNGESNVGCGGEKDGAADNVDGGATLISRKR